MNNSIKPDASGFDFEQKIINVIVVFGILLPSIQYFYNRSLWVDEAVLVLDIINTDSLDLLKPLKSGAVGTILFLFTCFFTIVFHDNLFEIASIESFRIKIFS